MLISDLPPGLKELAELRRKQYVLTLDQDVLLAAFPWSHTPEKTGFWAEISAGNFKVYYGCKVVNFKKKKHTIYRTLEGDSWEEIAVKAYGDVRHSKLIMTCNKGVRNSYPIEYMILPVNTKLFIPFLN